MAASKLFHLDSWIAICDETEGLKNMKYKIHFFAGHFSASVVNTSEADQTGRSQHVEGQLTPLFVVVP